MEIIRLAGYTEEEKAEIARRYLIPRQLTYTGLKAEQFQISDGALKYVISHYTREAGVRRLEQTLGRLGRKIALRFAEGPAEPVVVEPEELGELLGTEIFVPEQMRRNLPAGVACGLAWTEAGGDVLYVEGTLLPEGRASRSPDNWVT